MTGVSGTTSASATSPLTQSASIASTDGSSLGVTSGLSSVAPTLLLDMGSTQSDGGLSGLRLPQSSEDVTALLSEIEMKLNRTASQTRANGIAGAFAGRLGALGAITTALNGLPTALTTLTQDQTALATAQGALATDQGKLAASQADLTAAQDDSAAATADLTAKQADFDTKQGDVGAKRSDIASANDRVGADDQALAPLVAQSTTYAQTIVSLSAQAASIAGEIPLAQASGDTAGVASLTAQLADVQTDLSAAQTSQASVDGQIGTIAADVDRQNVRIALDQSWIATDEAGMAGDQVAIDADQGRIDADSARITADTADIATEQGDITADQTAVHDANAAVKSAQDAIDKLYSQIQASSLIVSSQLALTSGTDDRSRHNTTVSTQLDLGFERLQKSADEFRKKDVERTRSAGGSARDGDATAQGGRAETLAVGFTAALEAARATLLQLAQQATAASASAQPNRLRLSL